MGKPSQPDVARTGSHYPPSLRLESNSTCRRQAAWRTRRLGSAFHPAGFVREGDSSAVLERSAVSVGDVYRTEGSWWNWNIVRLVPRQLPRLANTKFTNVPDRWKRR